MTYQGFKDATAAVQSIAGSLRTARGHVVSGQHVRYHREHYGRQVPAQTAGQPGR